MKLDASAKRICIYFFYDRDGIVDKYVSHQLKDLRKNVDYIHCVVNGTLTSSGRKTLEEVTDQIQIRENRGNDVGAYKAALNYIGWEVLREYQELVLTNNTNFGPVYPFRTVFDWAKDQDVDFWGLTWDQKGMWKEKNKGPHRNSRDTFYNSCFLALRTPLFGSKLLIDFLDEIPDDATYLVSGMYFEHAFPGYFEDRGYTGAVFCDTTDDYNYPMLHNPVRLLQEYRMPLFKKRSFFHHYTDTLYNTTGEATAQLIRYLEEETDYDMDLVWDAILRTRNLADIVRCAQLRRVLPRDLYVNPGAKNNLKIGVVYHAYYPDLFDEDIAYIDNFPKDAGVLITTNTEEKKLLLEEKLKKIGRKGTVIQIANRGRDVSSLLVGAADFVFDYDLVCFGHDKKSEHTRPQSVGRSWAYKVNENVFATKEYVANVIDLFAKEKRLGIAFPPYPNHNVYCNMNTAWTVNFANTARLLKDLGANVNIHEKTWCVAPLGTCFWFRPEALKKLFMGYNDKGWEYTDFPREPNRNDETLLHAVERSYAYFAQDAGFYPAFIYNNKLAEIELTNLEFNLSGSAEMRAWVDSMALDAVGYANIEEFFKKPIEEITSEEIIQYHNEQRNYGIKESLKHLAFAIRCKYPRFWALMLPIRRIGQKVLGIKTK